MRDVARLQLVAMALIARLISIIQCGPDLAAPNGWNCRCYVQTLSERDLIRSGWPVSEAAPEARTVIKFIRGRPIDVPWGIDPGFAYNVGVVGAAAVGGEMNTVCQSISRN